VTIAHSGPRPTGLAVRPFLAKDEAEVLALLAASLGRGPTGSRSAELFHWKHLNNPFGRSLLVVGEADGRIIGLRAFMRWRFVAGDRTLQAVRAVDTATHPDFQGRGVFSELTRAALAEAREQADLVFNTPNEKSLPGYLKMGWTVVGRVPVSVRVRRPGAFLRNLHVTEPRRPRPPVEAPPAGEALGDGGEVTALMGRIERDRDRLTTPRTIEYLRWRYGSAPLLDYRAVRLEDGMAIFRVRPRGGLWEATVSELLVPAGDGSVGRRLLRAVARAAPVDHLTSSFPRRSRAARAARRAGFLPAPGGMTLVANPFGKALAPDPTHLRSWALSLGDLEVF
jgi:GNAT superfamily N-acetyltransferase